MSLLMTDTLSCYNVFRLDFHLYNVQDYSFLYNNVASPGICNRCVGWQFTRIWKAHASIISL
jgi:hypothetical protein